ncbi:hypothetical protein [Shewanella algae]|uniref:hypothetical protein n=1 Tax=Shewanella algae TaxID=38313 RepID=UPI00313E951F
MMYKTTLAAGQFNTFNGSGRFFYLVTAADKVTFQFLNKQGAVEFQSEFREGMSIDFSAVVHSVVIKTESAQYIEFWMGNSKLDYMSLAAGGAAANIQAGRAWAAVGASLAIPADFRRKKIKISSDFNGINVGGVELLDSPLSSYPLAAGEQMEIASRGDIYTYLQPMTLAPFTGSTSAWGHNTIHNGVIVDSATGNICHLDFNTPQVSVDDGVTFSASQIGWDPAESYNYKYMGSADGAHYILMIQGGMKGRIAVSYDGFLTWKLDNGLTGAGNPAALFLSIYHGWISPDGKTRIVIGRSVVNSEYNHHLLVLVTTNSFKTWAEYKGNIVHNYGSCEITAATADEFFIVDDTEGLYKLDLGGNLELIYPKYHITGFAVNTAGLFHVVDGRVYQSIDGGYVWSDITASTIGTNWAKAIDSIGSSLIVSNESKLALCSDYTIDNEFTEQALPFAGSSLPYQNRMFVKGNAIYFATQYKATANGGAAHFAKLDIEGFTPGAQQGQPMKWLAELN